MKLTIELIPKTTFFTNVRSLVSSSEWDTIRKKCYRLANHCCEICGDKGPKWPVECHEIWDYNFKTKTQTLKGLIALCPSCHEVKHMGLARLRGRYEEALNHFCKVNKFDKNAGEGYVREAFKEWEKKNRIKWKLNVEFLDNYKIED